MIKPVYEIDYQFSIVNVMGEYDMGEVECFICGSMEGGDMLVQTCDPTDYALCMKCFAATIRTRMEDEL